MANSSARSVMIVAFLLFFASVTLPRATARGFWDVGENCTSDADCAPVDEKCQNSKCVHCHMVGEPCAWDDQCCTGLECDLNEGSSHLNQCVKKSSLVASMTLPRATARGFGDVGENCTSDSDCAPVDEKCQNSKCVHCHMVGEPCAWDDQCCTGLECDLNEGSSHLNQCVKKSSLVASMTLARGFGDVGETCTTDADCAPVDEKCQNSKCVHCHMVGEPCAWDDQCCTGLECDLNEGSSHLNQCVKKSGLGAFLKSHLEMPIM